MEKLDHMLGCASPRVQFRMMTTTSMDVTVAAFVEPSNKDYVYARKANANTTYIGKHNEVLLLLKQSRYATILAGRA